MSIAECSNQSGKVSVYLSARQWIFEELSHFVLHSSKWFHSMNIMCSCIDLQWRKRKRCNIDDIGAQKHGRHCLPQPLYITLAKESPSRTSSAEDSEDTVYDSDLHGRETGTNVDVLSHIAWVELTWIHWTHTYQLQYRSNHSFYQPARLERRARVLTTCQKTCICMEWVLLVWVTSCQEKKCINATKLDCFRAQWSVVHLFLNLPSRR